MEVRIAEQEPQGSMVRPLVSIIVPSFNKEQFIGAMIDSVQAQTSSAWELLIVDDASTDRTPAILRERAAADPRIRLVLASTNRGANACRNQGIAEAHGRYAILLDADDLLAPHCVAGRLAEVEGKRMDLAVFTMEVFREQPGDNGYRWVPNAPDPLLAFLLHDLPWQTMQPLWDLAFLRRTGGFDTAFSRHQDVELHTRVLLMPGVRCLTFPGEPDCFYRTGEERKVFAAFPLLERYCRSAVLYHTKFAAAARERGWERPLLGMTFRTYLHVLGAAKAKKIDRRELEQLEGILLPGTGVDQARSMLHGLFRLTRWYGLAPFRVPGVNYLLFKAITGK